MTSLSHVNYMASANGGPAMWSNYSGCTSRADMGMAMSFGFNALRIFVPAVSGAFDWPNPTSAELASLQDFYQAAQSRGLGIHLTLFDLFGGVWGRIGASSTWAEAVIGALKAQDPALSSLTVIETHNEVWNASNRLQVYRGGYDAGWPAGVPQPAMTWDVALVWVQQMTYLLRSLAPGVPVTTSVPSGQGTASTGLGHYYSASNGTDWEPDWYDYHCYGGLSGIQSQLQAALSTVGGDPASLQIGECGNNINGTTATPQARLFTANYMQNVRYYCNQLGLFEPSPWMLFDMAPCGEFPQGQLDGLVDVTEALTTAGQMYRAYPAGVAPPKVSC